MEHDLSNPELRAMAQHIWERLPDYTGQQMKDVSARNTIQIVEDALRTIRDAQREQGRIEIIADAQRRGYLDHRDDCQKGISSETCTCGIMQWLVSDAAIRQPEGR